jgi:hypothetical protein
MGSRSVVINSASAVKTATATITPSIGPAIITFFGIDVPVMAFSLSMVGLLLARSIAPESRRKLTNPQEWALTALLILILLLVVTGQIGFGKPLGAGMSVVWGVGLGTSGLLAIEFFGEYVMDMLRKIMYGFQNAPKTPPKDDHE